MSNVNRDFLIVILVVITSWTIFLFGYEYLSNRSVKHVENVIVQDDNQQEKIQMESQHSSAQTKSGMDMMTGQDMIVEDSNIYDLGTSFVDDNFTQNDTIQIQNLSGISYDDLSALKKIYDGNPNTETLNMIIKKLLEVYEFSEAREYLADIDIFEDRNISIKDYIYTYINTLSLTDPSAITKFNSFIQEAQKMHLITDDDYSFYIGLVYIRNNNYEQGLQTMQNITTPTYLTFISQLSGSINTFKNQQGAPKYYQDALVSLVCMKNGYFALANKLAVDTVLQNDKYILPYQILSYSNFLTKNREKAIEYFYQLSSLDLEQKSKCDFYIGISYYRLGKYEKSISTLNQLISNDVYKSDVFRYLLLNYEKLGDTNKMIQVWQKQLGTYNLRENDFKMFFDFVFYTPFSMDEKFTIFLNYKQMAYDFVTTCYDKFGSKNDTCIYGEVGLDLANGDFVSAKSNLIYLSEKYPQANIFKALGDYYKKINEIGKAKDYYIKAASITDSPAQKMKLESILIDL